MIATPKVMDGSAGPKRRQRHYSYNENVNEPEKLIDDEPTDVEHAVPADDSEPIEHPNKPKHEPPVFEE